MTTTTAPTSYADRAAAIRALAREVHVAVTAAAHDGVVTVEARFPAGDRTAYAIAEAACNEVLARFPMVRAGSVWGTDSGSVGGYAGMSAGYCRLHKSGVEMRLARQFLGADAALTLAVDRATAKREAAAGVTAAWNRDLARREAGAAVLAHALELAHHLRATTADDGDDHLAHLGGRVIDVAADLRDVLNGDASGCADELAAEVASLTGRIKALLPLAGEPVLERMERTVLA